MKERKLLLTVFAAVVFLLIAGTAAAQRGGGGHMGGGGGWSGGGGGWHGGGGGWSGGGGWQGGSGWHGGCWNCGWHGSFGLWVGVPGAWWWPAYYPDYGYYGYPYYGYPYYTEEPAYTDYGPTEYVQRDTAPVEAAPPATQSQGQYTYYYCSDPAGYYPQVANCNRPWTKVIPNSPPPAPTIQ